MLDTTMPFAYPELRFGAILEQKFVKPAIGWMLKQKGSQILSSIPITTVEQDSCWWAAALYIESFLNAEKQERLFAPTERAVLAEQAVRLAKVLLENQSGNGAWDDPKGIWDTAAVCRSLILLVEYSKTRKLFKVTSGMKVEIKQSVEKALRWLIVQTINWEDLLYPFGPEDLAMVIRLLRLIDKLNLKMFPTEISNQDQSTQMHSYVVPKNARELTCLLVEHLLRLQNVEERVKTQIPLTHWNSPFVTAQIIRAFSDAFEILPLDIKNKCSSSMVGAISYIEEQQDEGKWGLPGTTSVVLESYVTTTLFLSKLENAGNFALKPKPEVVFKSLRWLTEQRSPDGSILHSFHHTTFFVLMLQDLAISNYYLLDYEVMKLYDYVVWNNQNRSSQERGERLSLTNQLIQRRQEISRYLQSYNLIMIVFRVLIIMLSFGSLVQALQIFGWITLTISPFSLKITESGAVVSAMVAYLGAMSAFWLYSKRWLRELK